MVGEEHIPWAQLHLGDCLDILRRLPANCIDAVATDPPYDLTAVSRNGSPRQNDPATPFGRTRLGGDRGGFMGKSWDGTGIAFRVELWREVLRVMKPGAYLVAFGGTRTYHRMACAIEDAGFEIKDSIHWVYGSGMPKGLNIAKALDKAAGHTIPASGYEPITDMAKIWDGWATDLRPSHEPIILAQKPLQGTYAANVTKWGVGGLNIDTTRVAYQSDADKATATPQGRATAKVGALAGGVQNDNNRTEFERPALTGRWPANFLLSHTPDCTEDTCVDNCPVAAMDAQSGPRKAGGKVKGHEPSRTGQNGIYGTFGRVENAPYTDEGGASRFFPTFRYCAKASRSERGEGNKHPTVKPITLMRWLVRLVAPPDAIVLDPFMGSGSTGLACVEEDRNFVGIEREEEYFGIAERRIYGEND